MLRLNHFISLVESTCRYQSILFVSILSAVTLGLVSCGKSSSNQQGVQQADQRVIAPSIIQDGDEIPELQKSMIGLSTNSSILFAVESTTMTYINSWIKVWGKLTNQTNHKLFLNGSTFRQSFDESTVEFKVNDFIETVEPHATWKGVLFEVRASTPQYLSVDWEIYGGYRETSEVTLVSWAEGIDVIDPRTLEDDQHYDGEGEE